MSYTESGRLSALKQTIRICTVNDAINRVRCSRKDPYGNTTAAGYGNSESGRISGVVTNFEPSGNCFTARGIIDNSCCDKTVPVTRTIQTQSSLIRKTASNAVECGPSILRPHISAGGIPESLRLQRLRDEVVAEDYATNPNARYKIFVPPICPPAQNANNLPLTQPRFPCAPNVVGFT